MEPKPTARAARSLIDPATNEHRFGSDDLLAGVDEKRRKALHTLSARLAEELDDHLIEALQRNLRRPIAGPQELAQLVQRMDQVPGEGGITYMLGTVQLLWVGAPEVEEVDGKLRAGREYRHLVAEVAR